MGLRVVYIRGASPVCKRNAYRGPSDIGGPGEGSLRKARDVA